MRTGLTTNARLRWSALGATIAIAVGGGVINVANATVSTGERSIFVAVTPCRLFDTRASDNVGQRKSPLATGETFTQAVRGQNGNCDVPADAVAVAMNVTAVNGSAASYLTVWPADASRPLASSLNWTAGAPPTPNKLDIRLSAAGAISFFNFAGSVDVLADVVGYYADHDHDDRYFTKAEASARFGAHVVRESISPFELNDLYGIVLRADLEGCVTAQTPTNEAVFPLHLPEGSTLLGVDVVMRDSVDTHTYALTLIQRTVTTSNITSTVLASASGGGGTISQLVSHRLQPSSPTVVDPGENFTISMLGFSLGRNSLCHVAIEYTEP